MNDYRMFCYYLGCFLFVFLLEANSLGCCSPPCTGCEKCVDGRCVDDDSKCSGCCDDCVNGACIGNDSLCSGCCHCPHCSCTDDDSKCSGCCNCVGCSCYDADSLCSGCCKCSGCGCVDDNSKCTGCCKCSGCGCVDDDSECNTDACYECESCGCEYQCDPGTQVCCDGVCKPKCEEIDEPRCKSEWNEDCIACVGIFEFCSHHNTRIFTDAVTYTCSGGCPGDCAEVVPQPVCSEVYKCKTGEWMVTHICTDHLDQPVPLDCYFQLDTLWSCSRCTTDYDERIRVHYPPYPSKKCQ